MYYLRITDLLYIIFYIVVFDIITCLVVFKLFEYRTDIKWALDHRNDFEHDARQKLNGPTSITPQDVRNLLDTYNYRISPGNNLCTDRIFFKFGLYEHKSLQFVFRYPAMVCILGAIIWLKIEPVYTSSCAIYLAVLIWTDILYLGISRYIFASIDNIFGTHYIDFIYSHSEAKISLAQQETKGKEQYIKSKIKVSRRQMTEERLTKQISLQNFMQIFLTKFALCTLAYGALYLVLSKDDFSFNTPLEVGSLGKHIENTVDILYFSLATMITVGYGSLEPSDALRRLVVGSQMAMVFIFAILLLTSFAATLDLAAD